MSEHPPTASALAARARLEAAFGSLDELSPYHPNRTWTFAVTHRGRAVRLGVRVGEGHVSGFVFAVPLGGRPLYCMLDPHFGPTDGAGCVRTGDPIFDGQLRSLGLPVEVVSGALGMPMRRQLLEELDRTASPFVRTEEGWLEVHRHCPVVEQDWREHSVLPEPAALARTFGVAVALADGLCRAFDTAHASIVERHGAPAAAAWLASQARQSAELSGRRSAGVGRLVGTAVTAAAVAGAVVLLLVGVLVYAVLRAAYPDLAIP